MKNIKTYEDFVNEEINWRKAATGVALGASLLGGMTSCKKDDIKPIIPTEQKIEQQDSLFININPGCKKINGGDVSIENSGYELFKNRWDWKVILNGKVIDQGYIEPGHPGTKNYTSNYPVSFGKQYLKIPVVIGDKIEIELISNKESKVNSRFMNYSSTPSTNVDTNDLSIGVSITSTKNAGLIGINYDAFMTNQIEQNTQSTDMGVFNSRYGESGTESMYLTQKTTINRPSNLVEGNIGINKVNMKFVVDEDMLKPNK